MAAPATILGTAEAQAIVIRGIQTLAQASRFAWIASTVQYATAETAATGLYLIGQILIHAKELLIESGIGKKGMTHY